MNFESKASRYRKTKPKITYNAFSDAEHFKTWYTNSLSYGMNANENRKWQIRIYFTIILFLLLCKRYIEMYLYLSFVLSFFFISLWICVWNISILDFTFIATVLKKVSSRIFLFFFDKSDKRTPTNRIDTSKKYREQLLRKCILNKMKCRI